MSPILFSLTGVYWRSFRWWINWTTSVMQCCTVKKELLLGLECLWEMYSHCLTSGCNSVLKIQGTFPEASFLINRGWGAGCPGNLSGYTWVGLLSVMTWTTLHSPYREPWDCTLVIILLWIYPMCFEVRRFALSFCLHLQGLLTVVKRLIFLSFRKSSYNVWHEGFLKQENPLGKWGFLLLFHLIHY